MSDDRSVALRLITPPAVEPVTLATAKAFLRIEHSADDIAITAAISAARYAAEQYLRIALLPQTWEVVRANPVSAQLAFPVGPAASITSVTLTNEAGVSSVMNAANYRLSVDGFAVLFTDVPQTEKLTVRYSAGAYASAAEIPAPMTQAMLHHMAVMVEWRDGSDAMPVQAVRLYQPFRRVGV